MSLQAMRRHCMQPQIGVGVNEVNMLNRPPLALARAAQRDGVA